MLTVFDATELRPAVPQCNSILSCNSSTMHEYNPNCSVRENKSCMPNHGYKYLILKRDSNVNLTVTDQREVI